MELLHIINGAVYFLICLVIIKYLLKKYKEDDLKRILNWYYIILICYVVLIFYSVAWFFGIFPYAPNDFNLIYSVVVFVQTLVLFKIVYMFNKDKKMLFFLLAYFLVFVSLSIARFSFFLLVISYLLSLALSLYFLNYHGEHKNIGYSGMAYSATALLFQFFLFFNFGEPLLYSLISGCFFLVFSFYFLRDAAHYPVKSPGFIKLKEESNIVLFIKYFVYIIVLTNVILISTIGIHELGHVVVSRFYDCESRAILYEQGTYPYSEIVCNDLSGKVYIALAGPILPLFLSLFLMILGGRFVKSLSLIIIGFNLLASYKDLQEIGISQSIVFATSILGIIPLFTGIALLAKSRMQESSQTSLL